MERFRDRVVVVFGAGSVGEGWGNGKAAAAQYAQEGGVVVAIDRELARAEATAQVIRAAGGRADSYACDVTRSDQIDSVITAVERAHGRIDVLHNNVGAPDMGKVADLDEAAWHGTMDINLTSVFLTCRRVLPVMVRQGHGAIVNISSIAAVRHTGYPYAAYYASKAGVNHLTVSIALDYAHQGVRCNAVMPGMMDTPHIYQAITGQYTSREEMVARRNALVPMGRMGTGWDVARAAAFLASDDAQYITGQCLAVDGGFGCRS